MELSTDELKLEEELKAENSIGVGPYRVSFTDRGSGDYHVADGHLM